MESDIVEVLVGTRLQTENLDLLENGRVILSSLEFKRIATEQNPEQKFIRWQRWKGTRNHTSKYAAGIDTSYRAFTGVGPTGRLKAIEGSAIMFVAIQYAYQPLVGNLFAEGVIINQEAAFTIRDEHNLSAGLNNDLASSRAAATYNKLAAR